MQINIERIKPDYFGIFEIANYDSEIKDNLLLSTFNCWEILSDWDQWRELEYKSGCHKDPPIYIFMVKIIFSYKLDYSDYPSVSLFFAQTVYDIFVSRIHITVDDLYQLASILMKITGDWEDFKVKFKFK